MSDILLDDNWDIDTTANSLSLVTKADEVRQLWHQRMQTFFGEWFLDVTVGIPYIQAIFNKQTDINIVRSLLLSETVNTTGILEVLTFDLSFDRSARSLRLDASVRAYDEIINFSEVLP